MAKTMGKRWLALSIFSSDDYDGIIQTEKVIYIFYKIFTIFGASDYFGNYNPFG